MPRNKTMIELIEILIRLKKSESIRNIKKETGTHRQVIRKVKDVSEKKGWLEQTACLPSETEMNMAYNAVENPDQKRPHILDKYQEDLKRYREEKISFVVIHRLISENSECSNLSETTIRRYIHQNFNEVPASVMIRPMEDSVMEVDYGYFGMVYDAMECRNRKAWIFSGRLRNSRKAYRETVYDQKAETFFKCHIRAFHYFGGVPKKIVPDNLKAAVIKAAFHDPIINRSYQELARHYDFLISPCLPRKPQHKGGVENDIKYICNNFWPYFVEKQKQKGRTTPLLTDIEESLSNWVEQIADTRKISGVGKSPNELFTEESKLLSLLPLSDWSVTNWKRAVVRPEWLVQYDCAYYSVPYKYIGKEVMICSDSKSVKVYLEYEIIANHERAEKKWEYKRNKLHAPPYKDEYLSQTSESIIAWAGSIGKSTLEVIEAIFMNKHIDGLRPARSLLFLSKKFTNSRLEKACRRAINYDTRTYISVKNILEKGLDKEETETRVREEINDIPFKYARSNQYYKI